MGSQFVSGWFQTMCSQLGIQQTYSPPHRPRANGRAERAGQQLLSFLKRVHVEEGLNLVQALPRALRFHHYMVGERVVSPYNLMFGREETSKESPTRWK